MDTDKTGNDPILKKTDVEQSNEKPFAVNIGNAAITRQKISEKDEIESDGSGSAFSGTEEFEDDNFDRPDEK